MPSWSHCAQMKSAARTFNGPAIVIMIMSSLSARSQKTRKNAAKMEGLCEDMYLRKAEEEEKPREKANNREQWKIITKVAVQGSDNWPASPLQNGNERKNKRERLNVADLFTRGGVKCCHRHKFDWNNGYIITKLLVIEDFVNVN